MLSANPNLTPEVAKTWTVGVVVTPTSLIKGMSFSADYYNISVYNVIQGIGADNILDTCATTGDPAILAPPKGWLHAPYRPVTHADRAPYLALALTMTSPFMSLWWMQT